MSSLVSDNYHTLLLQCLPFVFFDLMLFFSMIDYLTKEVQVEGVPNESPG